uniref:Homeobox protein cut-like n=1 Tax=Syphacia muris TaxID=451379 RepID=A0A0N5A967_9BILA
MLLVARAKVLMLKILKQVSNVYRKDDISECALLIRYFLRDRDNAVVLCLIRIEEEVKAIGLRQDDGDEGKRLLLQESTSFRENTDKVLRKKAVPLIKAFQAEVDRLTIRSKAAESFVIDLCRSLTALPDPSVYLGQLKTLIIKAQKLKNCEEEVCRLQSQISDLHNEYADLQNQELTVRSLREQIRNLEAEFELSVQKALKDFEKQQKLEVDAVKKEMDEKLEELEAENKKLRAEVADLEATSREAKDAVSNMRLKLEQREAMDDENLDIVSSDLEKAVYRAIQAEQEVLRLREEIEKMKENTTLTDSAVGNSALMRSKDNQIRKLLDENKKLVTRLSEEADEANKRIDNLTHQLGEQAETVKRLEAKLQAQSDYDEIKRELCVLRNVEFGEEVNSGEVSDNGVVSVATATAEIHSGGHLRALDELLVDKNHKLQNENAALRMRNNNIEEGEKLAKATVKEDNSLHEVSNPSGLLPTAPFDSGSNTEQWNKDEPFLGVRQSSANDNEIGDMQRCATNLLNLLMCTAGSSTSLISNSECSYGTDDEVAMHSYNSHENLRSSEESKTVSELQKCVNHNIRQLGMRPLNTAELARQCKRLMIACNIGQRLFAKFVMNQSQGSLSELLSKPRHWNKLTDKGREAFRRIYGWVSDERAVSLLCALAPRRLQFSRETKIETPSPESLWDLGASVLPFTRSQPEDLCYSEELYEKSLQKLTDEHCKFRGAFNNPTVTSQKSNSRWRHDDIPKEKIITIFQNELAKLKQQHDFKESNLEQAIISRSYLPNTLLNNKEDDNGTILSRKSDESIATSYSSVPSTSTLPLVNGSSSETCTYSNNFKNRPSLAPITQEQLERYPVLDTDDIVRRVREYLCAHSISQRQFGEHVLGLSQGSVSDLLARPKPWLLLTQKGREPFIRMQIFLSEAGLSAEINYPVGESKTSLNTQTSESGTEANFKTSFSLDNDFESKRVAIEGLLKMKDSTVDCANQKFNEEEPLIVNTMKECNSNESIEKLDAASVIQLVKKRLQTYGCSQKIFGDLVLGMEANDVSKLFRINSSCDLTIDEREAVNKMKKWLEISETVRISQNCMLMKSFENSLSLASLISGKSHSSAKLILQKRKQLDSSLFMTLEPPKKSQRTVITEQQKEALKLVFASDHHPSQRTIEQLSEKLSLNPRTVNNWFHNYRTRQKDLNKLFDITSKPGTVSNSLPKLTNRVFSKLTGTAESVKGYSDKAQLDRAVATMGLLVEQLDDCKRNGAVREAEINRLQSLVSRLENDLAAVNPVSALHSSRKISGDAPENEEDSAASLLASELDGSADSQKLNNSKNMLSIVLAQRDRLKIRVKDLESSIIEDREQKAFLESELEKAHQDNVQLYGKIKFLQNYRLNQQNNSTLQVDMNDVETRYKDEYERHIDPFKKFNAQERQRKYAQLKPYDKAALHLGRWVMSSGQSRAIFMFYLIFLHLLVFLVLYRFAYTESCQHDFRTDCIANFRNHMNRFHPGAPSEI